MNAKVIYFMIACTSVLNITQANASCDSLYVQAINETQSRIDKFKPEEAKKEKIRFAMSAAGSTTGVVVAQAITPLGLSGVGVIYAGNEVPLATTAALAGAPISMYLGDKFFGASDELPKLVERSSMLTSAYKLLKEGSAGGGNLVQEAMPSIWDLTKNRNISQLDVANKISELNDSSAFCQETDKLDSAERIVARTAQSLK